ncbi:MAG: YceD family protein [Bacilli bacterium]
MKIKIPSGVTLGKSVSETVDLSHKDFSANYSLYGIKPFLLTVNYDTFTEIVEATFKATVTVILECAYTLEHFEQEVLLDDTLCFNFVNPDIELESDDCFYEKGPYINVDPYVYALILSYIPLKAIKPGAKRPESGEGYSVLSEDEYNAKRQTIGDEFGDIFDQLDIDEE